MANACNNYLVVTGDVEEVEKFKEVCRSRDFERFNEDSLFSFEGIAPSTTQSNLESWGTKSDADVFYVYTSGNTLEVDFTTAWNPPDKWFKKACKQFPNLDFVLKFYELDSGVAGFYKSHSDGLIFEQVYREWGRGMVEFLYGSHEHGWRFGTLCEICFQESVELEDIVKIGRGNYIVCPNCIRQRQQQKDGGVA